MWYILIAIGIVWVVSKHNDKHCIDEELIKEQNEKWVNELIEKL